MVCLLSSFILSLLAFSIGYESADEAKLDEKLAALVSKGLITKERLNELKKELLAEATIGTEEATDKPSAAENVGASHGRTPASGSSMSTEPVSKGSTEREREAKVSDESSGNKNVKTGSSTKTFRRHESMEASMRAFGIDPDAIAKLGERRQPTDINSYVSAALQAAQAQETARARQNEELEDQEEAYREHLLQDDSSESEPILGSSGDASAPDLGAILPEHLQDKLAGILGRFGKSVDPEAGSLLSALMPNAGLEVDTISDDGEGGEGDGTTEDLAGLLASVRGNRESSLTRNIDAELEELRKERRESEERMEKAAEERRAEMARRQAQRDLEHEKFEAEMREREEQRKKDRAEFEESRRKHNEYMQRIEERKKEAAARRAELDEKRAQQQDRMHEALKMASEHINELKSRDEHRNGAAAHDDL